jgi:predicted metal-dependent enzyme (double-stranded beta helix superfamily)
MIDQTVWHDATLSPSAFDAPLRQTPLQVMLAEIATVVGGAGSAPDRQLAAVLAQHVGAPDLLDGIACPPSRARYSRHLLDGDDNHCVLAIVWMPGQMSPVHGHRTWCTLGVHRGSLTETMFRDGEEGLRLIRSRQLREGALSHAPAGGAIHRVANLGTEIAISIHVYGVPYDRLGHDVNDVRAD